MKKPWLAAHLNFHFYGVGYLYIGKRVLFGVLLLIVGIIESVYWFSALTMPPEVIAAGIIGAVAFAYDGYKDARELNRSPGGQFISGNI